MLAGGSPLSGKEIMLEHNYHVTDENGVVQNVILPVESSVIRIVFDGKEYNFNKKIEQGQNTLIFTIK